jgi:hypothetical protein
MYKYIKYYNVIINNVELGVFIKYLPYCTETRSGCVYCVRINDIRCIAILLLLLLLHRPQSLMDLNLFCDYNIKYSSLQLFKYNN